MKKKIYSIIASLGIAIVGFGQNVPSYVPTNGLVGYWPFSGNANDVSGNGNNGTVTGATLTADRNGNPNSAYSFDGVSNFIEVVSNSQISMTSSYSIAVWVNVNQFNSGGFPYQPAIISKIDGGDWYGGYEIRASGDANNTVKYLGTSGNIGGQNTSLYKDNQVENVWTNVVVTYSGSKLKFYLNGICIDSVNRSGNLQSSSLPLRFGRRGGSNNCWYSGKIDDIGMWNRALTQQEITDLFNANSSSSFLSASKISVDALPTVHQNDTLELAINTSSLSVNDGVISYQSDLSFDSTRYTYLSSNLVGTLNPSGNVIVNSTKKGKLSISYMSQSALSGAGSLMKIKFKANKTIGQGIFALSNFIYNTTAISDLKSDTVTTIDVTPPTAKLAYSQNPVRKGDSLLITVNFSEKMAVSPISQISLSGENTLLNSNLTKVNDTTYTYWWIVEKGNGLVNVSLASGTDISGNIITSMPTLNPTFTVIKPVFGDVDTNNLIQAYDAALTLQYSVGLNPLPTMDPLPWSNWRIAVANVDTLGGVTANDASLILQYSAKLISTFPADSKKRGGSAPVANVTVSQEGDKLIFKTTGELFGLNIFMKDNFELFGAPDVLDKNMIVATNINESTYNVGLASTTATPENVPFLVIPLKNNSQFNGTIEVVSNTETNLVSLGSAAGVISLNTTSFKVFPNPTSDLLTISNALGNNARVIDVAGKTIFTTAIPSVNYQISMKSFAGKGVYFVQILGENERLLDVKKVVVE